jgi:hypothetical protein
VDDETPPRQQPLSPKKRKKNKALEAKKKEECARASAITKERWLISRTDNWSRPALILIAITAGVGTTHAKRAKADELRHMIDELWLKSVDALPATAATAPSKSLLETKLTAWACGLWKIQTVADDDHCFYNAAALGSVGQSIASLRQATANYMTERRGALEINNNDAVTSGRWQKTDLGRLCEERVHKQRMG